MTTHLEHDTTVVKIDSKGSPRGAKGEKYLASGVRVSMRLWEDEPPGETGETERDYETVGYVIAGRAELHVEGQVVRLEPGDSYVVPRSARHHYRILEALTAIEATSPPAHVHGRDKAEGPTQGGEQELDVKERFVRDVESHAALPPHVRADSATAAVMCTLTERLTAGEAHELLESMPHSLRPLFQRCIEHRKGPVVERVNRAEFLDRIATHLDVTPAHAELLSAAVFEAVHAQLPRKLITDVAHQLPGDLQDLWLHAGAVADSSRALSEDEAQRVLAAIATRAPLPPGTTAGDAFSAVMCALFDRVSGGEVRDVLLGLPASIRVLVEHCAVHRGERADVFHREQLLNRVQAHLGTEPDVTEAITREVFAAVARVLPAKEVHDVASQLPEDLRELWGSTRS